MELDTDPSGSNQTTQSTNRNRYLRRSPWTVLHVTIEDGTNAIFMTFGNDLVVSEEAVDSVERALQADCDHDRPTKRR